ncbi:MAG: S8 family serine peptidase [Symploca sp. SIO3C6]|nr:S8 family serine peptidase [Symploca sp. SIO3C6]NET07972.1 S8 family serine peptidase [Symploca sp. SIO2B6]
MTRQSRAPKNSTQTTGVPEKNLGVLLQRGGEELVLLKASDRFTVKPSNKAAIEELASSIRVQHHGPIARTQLQEFAVEPQHRDEAMRAARNHHDVAYASHVYYLQGNPETLIYLTDQLTIQFIPEVEEDAIRAMAAALGLQLLKSLDGIPNTFIFQLTSQARENPVKIANRLMVRPEVLTAEPEIVVPQEAHYRPRDDRYPQQWYLNHNGGSMLAAGSHIDVEKAWDITRGKRSIVVAVTDDAIDLNHPDFQGQGKIVAPRDFKDKDFIPLPGSKSENHGTACAGVAVAEENGSGIVGVAPGCALMPIRTTGFLDDSTIEELFDWVVKHGASVISCSWGPATVRFSLSLRQRNAITRAATKGRQGKGCVIVFAAGNANRPVNGTIFEKGWSKNVLKGPTKWLGGFTVHPDVITVSSCTSLSKKSAYSNWGVNVSVCAPSNNAPPGMWFAKTGYIDTAPPVRVSLPGRGVFSTDQVGEAGYESGDFVRTFGGTSSACPVVAGVAALVLSVNPNLSAQEVRQILEQTADKIVDRDKDPQLGMRLGTYDARGHSQWFGYGKVNAYKAVKAAQSKTTQSPLSGVKRLRGRNDNRLSIADNNPQGVTSAIRVKELASVQDIKVSVDIEHEFLGDIEIKIIAPSDQTVLLQNRTLGSQTQLQATYTVETAPALKQLLNKSAEGIWRLQIIDYALMDTGELKSWELILGVA